MSDVVDGLSVVLYLLIVGCELAFWVVLLASLAARYLLRLQAVSRGLLLSLPLIDLLLIGFTALDLRAGSIGTFFWFIFGPVWSVVFFRKSP